MRDLADEKVDLAQARLDGVLLIGGERERGEPRAASFPEQITHRRATFEVAHEHRADLVLGAGSSADELRAAGREPAQQTGLLIADPHARDEIGGQELSEGARVELVVLDLRVTDRPHMHRVGDHDLADERLKDARDLQRVAGALEDHLVLGGETVPEQGQRVRGGAHPPR